MESQKNSFTTYNSQTKRISRTLSRFYAFDSKLPLTLENPKQTLIPIKNAQLPNPSMDDTQSNHQNFHIKPKNTTIVHNSIPQLNQKCLFKSIQAKNHNRISTNSILNLQKLKPSISISQNQKQNLAPENTKLSLEKKSNQSKTPLRIIDLLRGNPRKTHHSKKKRVLSQNSKPLQIQSNISKFHLKKYDQYENIQNPPYSKPSKLASIQTSIKSSEVPDKIQNHLIQRRTLKINKIDKLKICSYTNSLNLYLSQKDSNQLDNGPQHILNANKVDKQIQTYQTQPQFFEYLAFKRKKQQYEKELQEAFNHLQIIKKDQELCFQRFAKAQQIYQEPPKDEREQRIFDLKKQIQLYQNKIITQIGRKNKENGGILERMRKVDELLVNGFKQIEGINKSYLNIFRVFFQKHQASKYVRISSRIQTLSTSMFKKMYTQIKQQMENCYKEKENTKELRYCLTEFMKCVNEEKVLLKNCFQHIKYMPELFLKLFGDQIQQNKSKDIFSVLAHTMKQKDLLKCIKCYNTDRKMCLIVETNAQIKSILKVADQLVS